MGQGGSAGEAGHFCLWGRETTELAIELVEGKVMTTEGTFLFAHKRYRSASGNVP